MVYRFVGATPDPARVTRARLTKCRHFITCSMRNTPHPKVSASSTVGLMWCSVPDVTMHNMQAADGIFRHEKPIWVVDGCLHISVFTTNKIRAYCGSTPFLAPFRFQARMLF